jgi:hypothetical protein
MIGISRDEREIREQQETIIQAVIRTFGPKARVSERDEREMKLIPRIAGDNHSGRDQNSQAGIVQTRDKANESKKGRKELRVYLPSM